MLNLKPTIDLSKLLLNELVHFTILSRNTDLSFANKRPKAEISVKS